MDLRELMILKAAGGNNIVNLIEIEKSGTLLTFLSNINQPLSEYDIDIVATQQGSGTPSPSNIMPIVGVSGFKVYRKGKNLLPRVSHTKEKHGIKLTYNTDGSLHISGTSDGYEVWLDLPSSSYFTLVPGKYTLSGNTYGYNFKGVRFYMVGSNGEIGISDIGQGSTATLSSIVSNCRLQVVVNLNANTEIDETFYPQLEVGESATVFESPKENTEYTITFDDSYVCYGGTLDVVNGELTATHLLIDVALLPRYAWNKSSSYPGGYYINVSHVQSSIKKNTPFLCSHGVCVNKISDYLSGTCFCDTSLNFRLMDENSTMNDWTNYLDAQKLAGTPVMVVAELATPITMSVDPVAIETLTGVNNILNNAGMDNNITYVAKQLSNYVKMNEFSKNPNLTVIGKEVIGTLAGIKNDGEKYMMPVCIPAGSQVKCSCEYYCEQNSGTSGELVFMLGYEGSSDCINVYSMANEDSDWTEINATITAQHNIDSFLYGFTDGSLNDMHMRNIRVEIL
jgi:hypothetical protein